MTISKISTLAEHQWPSGMPSAVAVLRGDIAQITLRYGWPYFDDVDGLGSIRQVYLRMPTGRVIVLRQHREDNAAHTEVYTDSNDNLVAALAELSHALGLNQADCEWTHAEDS